MVELALLRQGRQVHRIPLEGVVHIGRAPHNTLALSDDGISRSHATVWVHDGRVWLRDNGSTNGSFVGGRRVEGALPIDDGDHVRLGKDVELVLLGAPEAERPETEQRVLEDVESGMVLPLEAGLNLFGAEHDHQIPGVDGDVRVQVAADGSVRVGDRQLDPGATFQLAGRSFRLGSRSAGFVPTKGQTQQDEGFHVALRGDGATGVECVVRLGEAQALLAGNRAIVLFILARQWVDDRERGRLEAEQGWVHDDDLTIGIWGREGLQMDANGLHVLLYRLRQRLTRQGIEASLLLEKRRKATRLVASRVELP